MDAYSHLALAQKLRPVLQQGLQRHFASDEVEAYLPYFLAGGVGPDSGHFYAGAGENTRLLHQLRCADFARSLLAFASGPGEYAFSLGWLSHVLCDIDSHPKLVHHLTDRYLQEAGLSPTQVSPAKYLEIHMRLELGLGCLELAAPEGKWLWQVSQSLELPEALFEEDGFFCRAFTRTYGKGITPRLLRRQWQRALHYLDLMPLIFSAVRGIDNRKEMNGYEKLQWTGIRALSAPLLNVLRPLRLWFNARIVLAPIVPVGQAAQYYRQYIADLQKKLTQDLPQEAAGLENFSLYSGQLPWVEGLKRSRKFFQYYHPERAKKLLRKKFPHEADRLFAELDEFYRRCHEGPLDDSRVE